MRPIIIEQYGRPEQLAIREHPDPVPLPGHVVIQVKAFGLNHAEIYFRKGVWGEVARVNGIECVGVVNADPEGRFAVGQQVAALMGGCVANRSTKQDIADLFYLKPFIYGLSSDVAPELSNSKTISATHPIFMTQ